MNDRKPPTLLMIMDGFGKAPAGPGNAISLAKTPHLDDLFANYSNTSLKCGGQAVGLPDGQMGNSEVGHLNIGAGRIIYQELSRISNAIKDGTIFENQALLDAMHHVKKTGGALHLMGLLSDGGVHSHIEHLFGLLDMAKAQKIKQVYVHGLLDGRDVPPQCAVTYIEQLETYMNKIGLGTMATISGRYYGMDRDKRWERVQKYYDAMTLGKGLTAPTAACAVTNAYGRGETDEFVLPTCIEGGQSVKNGDSIIMFNFRPDRAREITRCFVDPDFDGFTRQFLPDSLCYVCMTQYDATMPNVKIAYQPEHYDNTLGEYISNMGLTQLRIAETEKYAHVTFFFNGGVEQPNKGEDRILLPSPKVATYDLQPEMSAYLVTDALLEQLDKSTHDLIIVNLANCDMVGHTGVLEAAIKAVEAVDTCVGRIAHKVLELDGKMLLTADHGNADDMLDGTKAPMTAHSLNDVPLVYIAADAKTKEAGQKTAGGPTATGKLKEGGRLCDLAPTLLTLMNLPIPTEMTGISLLKD